MKYWWILALSLFAATPTFGQWDTIQVEAPVNNIIKISPFHFVEGTFLLAYERMLSSERNKSLMFVAGMHSRQATYNSTEPSFGTIEELQFRYYVSKPQDHGVNGGKFMYFKGFYAGPFLYHRYRSQARSVFDWVAQANVTVKENINEVAGGVLLGVQVAFGNRLFVDFYTGGGVKHSFGVSDDPTFNDFPSVTSVGYNGVIPKIGFLIGVGL